MHKYLEPYLDIIGLFVQNKLSAKDFSEKYIDLFLTSNTHFENKNEFLILDSLFASADAYCEDPNLHDENDIDEKQLLKDAIKASEELKNLG